IIAEQSERARSEFENVLNTLKEKSENIDPKAFEDMLSAISKSSKEIQVFSKVLSKYPSTNENEIKGLNTLQETLRSKYDELLREKKDLEHRLEAEQQALDKAQREKEEA